jgi:hypothetical protein
LAERRVGWDEVLEVAAALISDLRAGE